VRFFYFDCLYVRITGGNTVLEVKINESIKNYKVYIQKSISGLHELLEGYIEAGSRFFIITDSRVGFIYNDVIEQLEEKLDCSTYVFNEGEENKNIYTVSSIYDFLVENKADRNSILIAIGGGVVGDITGFAAATFMRGISYLSIPTTLVAQVDSSVGGKVGYNHKGLKNIVGAFYNPEFVYISTDFLKTLEKEQILDGLGEVIKYGLIADESILDFIEKYNDEILSMEDEEALHIVLESLRIKVQVISEDFKDTGLRNILNFGHTIGHGIEAESNYTIPHGIAVALGMLAAIKLSEKYTGLSPEIYSYITSLYKKLGIPVTYKVDNYEAFLYAIRHDKKNNEKINFVLLERIGSCKIKIAVSEEDILWAVNNSFQVLKDL
jgi:3-dehydroquinate synthase